MKYVMSETERKLYEMIEQDGFKTPLSSLIRVYIEYGHNMSDLGLKEKAIQAIEIADILKDVRDTIDE